MNLRTRTRSTQLDVRCQASRQGDSYLHLTFGLQLFKGPRRELDVQGPYMPDRSDHPIARDMIPHLLAAGLPVKAIGLHPLQTSSEISLHLERPLRGREKAYVAQLIEDACQKAGYELNTSYAW